MGTNSAVYEAQLAPVRAQLDPSHEFVFLDGQIECEAATGMKILSNFLCDKFCDTIKLGDLESNNIFFNTGVEPLFPGPYYCYYSKPTPDQLQDAYDLINEAIEEDGPFDGVFGFSQGGALAASMLLQHAKTNPQAPEPFKLAVFTCASLPFDLDTEKRVHKYNTVLCLETGKVSVRDWIPGEKIDASAVNGFVSPLKEGETSLQRYHPEREKARIRVPTLHIMGRLDPFVPQSELLADLCEEGERSTYVHELGHKLPRDLQFARKAATAINSMIYKILYKS